MDLYSSELTGLKVNSHSLKVRDITMRATYHQSKLSVPTRPLITNARAYEFAPIKMD